jgi:hypothetical protein
MRRLITERFLVCTWRDAARSSIGGEIDVQEELELKEAELRRDDELGATVLFGMCVVPKPLADAFERVHAHDEGRGWGCQKHEHIQVHGGATGIAVGACLGVDIVHSARRS